MKELIIWKEVDEKEYLNDINSFRFLKDDEEVWLKRVVIPILSDQEIEDSDDNFDNPGMNAAYREGYKALRKLLIGGEGS